MTSQYSPGGRFSEQGQQSSEDLKRAARSAAQKAKRSASEVVSQAQEQAGSLIDNQKKMAADRVKSVADALREAGNKCQQQDDTVISGYANTAAGKLDEVSDYLREHDLRDLLRQGESLARRHPAIFLGSMFIGGLLLGRFLRASSHSDENDFDGGYERGGDQYMEGSRTGRTGDFESSTTSPGQQGQSNFSSRNRNRTGDPGSRKNFGADAPTPSSSVGGVEGGPQRTFDDDREGT
jgi:hypothetical protein